MHKIMRNINKVRCVKVMEIYTHLNSAKHKIGEINQTSKGE